MAEFKNDQLGVAFVLPDAITVRKQLAYRAAVVLNPNGSVYNQYWQGFLVVAEGWECEIAPDLYEIDLDEDTRPAVTNIVVYACNNLAEHMNRLEDVPKN